MKAHDRNSLSYINNNNPSGEAVDIFKIAKKLKLTKRSYAWIVAQSVVGQNEHERAPNGFHPGLLGKLFTNLRLNYSKIKQTNTGSL